MYKYEEKYWRKNLLVSGVDEVGRGPMAGPLVVALVVLPINYHNQIINDSKVLSDKKRRLLFDEILNNALYIDVEIVNEKTIDDLNIYHATKSAMSKLIERSSVNHHLVDAMPIETNKSIKSIIKGDSVSISIAAASIIAKVIRDDIMIYLDEGYPNYKFKNHKGYPTKAHKECLKLYGILPIHRKSYKPVMEVLENQK